MSQAVLLDVLSREYPEEELDTQALWGQTGYFSRGVGGLSYPECTRFQISKMLVAMRRRKWSEGKQREQLEGYQPCAEGESGWGQPRGQEQERDVGHGRGGGHGSEATEAKEEPRGDRGGS